MFFRRRTGGTNRGAVTVTEEAAAAGTLLSFETFSQISQQFIADSNIE